MTVATLRVGDRVELVTTGSFDRDGIIPLRPGDRGVIRAVGHARYAVDFGGVLVVVDRDQVMAQGAAHVPGGGL